MIRHVVRKQFWITESLMSVISTVIYLFHHYTDSLIWSITCFSQLCIQIIKCLWCTFQIKLPRIYFNDPILRLQKTKTDDLDTINLPGYKYIYKEQFLYLLKKVWRDSLFWLKNTFFHGWKYTTIRWMILYCFSPYQKCYPVMIHMKIYTVEMYIFFRLGRNMRKKIRFLKYKNPSLSFVKARMQVISLSLEI